MCEAEEYKSAVCECEVCSALKETKDETVQIGNVAVRENENVEQGTVLQGSAKGLSVETCTINGLQGSLLRDTGCTTAGVKQSFVSKD